ncbi:MAG: MFS transporter [Candidatus Nanopelagicales bacterium]
MNENWMTSGQGHPRRWAILGVLIASLLMIILDTSVLNIALPTIQRDLQASQSDLIWAVDAYTLAFAALLFTWGVLGDRIGRKKVLFTGMAVFGLASFAASFSASPGILIGWRVVMGIAGAAVMPTTLAIITVVFPPHERGRAIGMWAGSVGAAIALGPVIGGVLLEHPEWSSWLTQNDWGSVFLINIPVAMVGLIGIWRVVPETRNPHAGRLDLMGLLVSVAGLVSLVYGIIHASELGHWAEATVVGPIALGIAILALFVWSEARSDHSSFDVSLFKNRGYAVTLTAVTLAFFAMSGITFTLPFYFQVVRGFSTLAAGFAFLPFAIGQIIAAPRSAAMASRFGYRRTFSVGLTLVALSIFVIAQLQANTALWIPLTAFFFFGLGMGNVIAPGSAVLQNVLPLARAGAGSAVQNTVRQVGGALGVAVMGTVLATQYASALAPTLAKLPQLPDAARAAASKSLIATTEVIGQAASAGMPAAAARTVLDGAYQAFISASHDATYLSLAAVLLALATIVIALPDLRPPTKAAHAPAPSGVEATQERIDRETGAYVSEAAAEYGEGERAR